MNARVASFQQRMKSKGYSRRTIDSYVWYATDFGKFLLATKVQESKAPGEKISAYLAWLFDAGKSRVTQNVAFNALRLLYKLEFSMTDEQIGQVEAPRRAPSNYIPTVLRGDEVRKIIDAMTGTDRLMAAFLYGTGARIDECVNLRIKDLDFAGGKVRIYDGKGGKARETLLPTSLVEPLKAHLVLVRRIHDMDLRHGHGRAELPKGCGAPAAAEAQWEWQYVFPAGRLSSSLDDAGVRRRWYYHPDNLRKALRAACRKIGEKRPVTPHTFRHSFATQLLYSLTYPQDSANRISEHDARQYVKSLMGHVSEKTFEHYTRCVLEWASPRMVIVSPADAMLAPSR
jgi:integrase